MPLIYIYRNIEISYWYNINQLIYNLIKIIIIYNFIKIYKFIILLKKSFVPTILKNTQNKKYDKKKDYLNWFIINIKFVIWY